MEGKKYYFYKLVCKDVNVKDCYVGCTINKDRRKCHHKISCNNENIKTYNLYVYQYIREHGGWANWQMIIIDDQQCKDISEARKLERYYLEQCHATLNKLIPSRTHNEYIVDNKDKISEYQKEYTKQNKSKITEYQKEYQQKNKEELYIRRQKYYSQNKNKILEQIKNPYTCPNCHSTIRIGDKARHERTKKHQSSVAVTI